MKSLNEENYLKAIFHLIDKDDTFTVNELSKMLSIKMPSVNSMMKKIFSEKLGHLRKLQTYKNHSFRKKRSRSCGEKTQANRNVFSRKNGLRLGGRS